MSLLITLMFDFRALETPLTIPSPIPSLVKTSALSDRRWSLGNQGVPSDRRFPIHLFRGELTTHNFYLSLRVVLCSH